MPTFQDDLEHDLGAVFFDTTGQGFGEAVRSIRLYALDGTSAETALATINVEQIFSIYDDKLNRLFYLRRSEIPASVTPERVSRIVEDGGDVWEVLDVQEAEGMAEFRTIKAQEAS